jgi:hypothetical protein
MEREEIKRKFTEKGFNEETINLLLGVIDDFEATQFTQYVPIQEVVDRICNNLSTNIKFVRTIDVNGSKNTIGRYTPDTGEILILEDLKTSPSKLKSTVFHEVLHCITHFKDISSIRLS